MLIPVPMDSFENSSCHGFHDRLKVVLSLRAGLLNVEQGGKEPEKGNGHQMQLKQQQSAELLVWSSPGASGRRFNFLFLPAACKLGTPGE
ncbi:hypothetical protein CEXT_32431 [Caerostris extrusa]|uniref:Uncharacterized protein n=1 Tax=Caerostris extrusa TaxID=172846 RepID=A0AAV4RRS1_CAEEX|nr:hypothetical protein CEXT_32431 [Caerostris extrusa]